MLLITRNYVICCDQPTKYKQPQQSILSIA
jgi:hypothetical protein